jgi:hypothetical protein
MKKTGFTSLAMLSLLAVGACSDNSVTGPGGPMLRSASLDLAAGTAQQFCSGGTVGSTSNFASVTGSFATAGGYVPVQNTLPWTGTAANLTGGGSGGTALWVIPFNGANLDAPDNVDYVYTTTSFIVPTGYTAVISGSALRDNALTDVQLTGTATQDLGGEIANNNKANFGTGAPTNIAPVALAFGTTTAIGAGTYQLVFTVHNEDLLNDPGNHGLAYPNAGRGAPNPTGLLECFTVTPTLVAVPEGCSPGYYKTHAMPGGNLTFAAAGFTNTGTASGVTLKASLDFGGGPTLQDAKNVLLRQAAAAYANSIRLNNYPLTTAQVIAQTNAALASGNRATILAFADVLNTNNNLEGPNC